MPPTWTSVPQDLRGRHHFAGRGRSLAKEMSVFCNAFAMGRGIPAIADFKRTFVVRTPCGTSFKSSLTKSKSPRRKTRSAAAMLRC